MRPSGRRRPAVPGGRLAQRYLVLLDVDGTLVPIAKRPSAARLPVRTGRILRRLVRQPGIGLGFVSGRSLADLRRLIGIPAAYYVGNHGLELRGRGVAFVHPAARASRPLLARLARSLRQQLRGVPGTLVEWKGLTISAHWRNVPPASRRRFRSAVRRCLRAPCAQGTVRVTAGKRVVEVHPPVAWGKGKAVEWLWTHAPHARRRLIYIGDDQTDEDAFRMVNRLGGMTVFVGPAAHATAARSRLRNPSDVTRWLEQLPPR